VEQVTVTAKRLSLIGTASTASEGVVVNDELSLTPAYRPGELLETVPGLAVTIHSGEGKANQFLLRGYNLDHGTDIAISVDGMPVNEPTHAHGQGYADMNFLIPELATHVTYTKGTYYASEGNFASVGSVHVRYLDETDSQVSLSAGTDHFERMFAASSQALGGDGHLLEAVEAQHYNGPWVSSDDQRKINAVLRYSRGDEEQGGSLTAMLYHDLWNATTDQPLRAITQGLISRFGTLDPSDGGYAQRASLSGQWHQGLGTGQLSLSAYVISNRLTLWNNFTHDLVDPVNGDQERQHEDRITSGGELGYAWTLHTGGVSHEWLFGLHERADFNEVSRLPTEDRILLTPEQLAAVGYPSSFSEQDRVRLLSTAGFIQVTTRWTSWFRSVLGLREDYQRGTDTGTHAGTASATLLEPKASLIFRPSESTELYASWGRGFHSNDLRGVTQALATGSGGAPLIARQTGEEVGVRQQLAPNLTATLALYNLDAQSETTYDPDVGQDSAGPASRRRGVEVNVTYQALRWLELYGSYSANHARYTTPYDDGTGHVGYYLPNAPIATGSLNMYVKNLGPWDGSLAYRYLSTFPLSSDNVIRGHGYGEWNVDANYHFGEGWRAGLALYNLLNTHANSMEFWYVDRLAGESAPGVADVHVHPLEPFEARFVVSKSF
jgi:outer membrane receptor protein involved in Fe transport